MVYYDHLQVTMKWQSFPYLSCSVRVLSRMQADSTTCFTTNLARHFQIIIKLYSKLTYKKIKMHDVMNNNVIHKQYNNNKHMHDTSTNEHAVLNSSCLGNSMKRIIMYMYMYALDIL